MKAVVLDSENRLTLSTARTPTPAAGEVAVRVAYAGVQWGDVLVRDGRIPVPRPFVPGFEAAGHITAVGDGVDPARVGAPVAALTASGAFAETVTAPAVLAFDAAGVDLRTAAAFGWAAPTAHDLVTAVARVRPGDRVLVHAALGGVGSLAAQLARRAGAARVVGVGGTAANPGAYAADLGYHRLVPRADFPHALGDERFDVVLDPVGGRTRRANLDRLAPHGRLVAYGAMDSREDVRVDPNDLLHNGTSVLTYNGNLLSRTHPERLAATAAAAMRLLAAGDLRIDITAEYALADVATALDRLAAGGTRGKAVVRIG